MFWRWVHVCYGLPSSNDLQPLYVCGDYECYYIQWLYNISVIEELVNKSLATNHVRRFSYLLITYHRWQVALWSIGNTSISHTCSPAIESALKHVLSSVIFHGREIVETSDLNRSHNMPFSEPRFLATELGLYPRPFVENMALLAEIQWVVACLYNQNSNQRF